MIIYVCVSRLKLNRLVRNSFKSNNSYKIVYKKEKTSCGI